MPSRLSPQLRWVMAFCLLGEPNLSTCRICRLRGSRRRCALPPSPISGFLRLGLLERQSNSSRVLKPLPMMLSSFCMSATSGTRKAQCGYGTSGWRCARLSPALLRTWSPWATTSTVRKAARGIVPACLQTVFFCTTRLFGHCFRLPYRRRAQLRATLR